MTDIASLLAKARQATGPDREIDADIYRLVYDDGSWIGGNWYVERDVAGPLGSSHVIVLPAYTGSLDSSIELIETKLPGWWWQVSRTHAELHRRVGLDHDVSARSLVGPELALVCAFLQAWESVK